MKVITKFILILTVCHQGFGSALTPSPDDGSARIKNYFQAKTQTFHICSNFTINQKPELNNKPEPVIPGDYKVHPGIGAYKLHLFPLTWSQARRICLSEGAHLAVITSAEEENILRKMQQSKDPKSAEFLWLGVHSLYEQGDWVTVFDQPLSDLGYVHWRTGEPNNLNNVEHCATATVNGMNDSRCDKELSFFCKIDLK